MYVKKGNNNRILCISFDIKDAYYLKQDSQEKRRFTSMMHHFIEQFINMQKNNALDLVQYAEHYGCDISSGILIAHTKGMALCNISSYLKNKAAIRITPFISLSSGNLMNGFEFSRGMSDVDIIIKDNEIEFHCTDILLEHELFLMWIAEKMEHHWTDKSFYPKAPVWTDHNGREIVAYFNTEDERKFESLIPLVSYQMSLNSSKRIETLTVKNLTVKEYIHKNSLYKFCNSDNDIFKACLWFGKPYSQMRKYIEKNGL